MEARFEAVKKSLANSIKKNKDLKSELEWCESNTKKLESRILTLMNDLQNCRYLLDSRFNVAAKKRPRADND